MPVQKKSKKLVGRPVQGSGIDPLRVKKTALSQIDKNGLQKLTMRGLAREIGVDIAALYYHFDSKEALLSGVVDLIFDQMKWNDDEVETWQALTLDLAEKYRGFLIKHPNAFPLIVERGRSISNTPAYEVFQEFLSEFGLTQDNVREIVTSIELICNGAMSTFQPGSPDSQHVSQSDFRIACQALISGLAIRFEKQRTSN